MVEEFSCMQPICIMYGIALTLKQGEFILLRFPMIVANKKIGLDSHKIFFLKPLQRTLRVFKDQI